MAKKGRKKILNGNLTAIRMPPRLKDTCTSLANEEGLTFSEWVRAILRQKVRRAMKQRQSA